MDAKKILFPILIESLWFSIVIGVITCLVVCSIEPHPQFASRWDGTCTGWTKPLCWLHIVSEVITYVAYVVIAVAMARIHPVMDRIRSASLTVGMISCVFVSCGVSHLVKAVAIVHPAYRTAGAMSAIVSLIAFVGALCIVKDLAKVRYLVRRDRDKLREFESKRCDHVD